MRRVKDEGWIHIEWSAEEQAFVGTSDSYPKLACFSKTAEDALVALDYDGDETLNPRYI